MTASRDQLEGLVVRMQQDFLENPRLTLTLADALKRFGAEEATCEAIMALMQGTAPRGGSAPASPTATD